MNNYIEEYMNYLTEVKQAAKNTKSAYATDLKLFAAYLEKEKVTDFSKITETRMNAYLLYLKKKGKSPATIARSLVSIKNFMLYLIKHQVIFEDPTERIHPPKLEKKVVKAITIKQMEALLEQPNIGCKKGKRDRAMLELMYGTGMKVTELINLKIDDVNLRFGCVAVISEGKERVLPLGAMAKEMLTLYLDDLSEEEKNRPYLFCNRMGEQLTRQGVYKLVKEYGEAAGLKKDFSLQIIRNSFAVHMLNNGADYKSIQELLGLEDMMAAQRYNKGKKDETFKTYQRTHPRAKKTDDTK